MRLWSVPGIDADLEAATALLSLSRIGRLPSPERACLYEPPNSAGCSGRVRVEIIRLLEDPMLVQGEIDRRQQAARSADPLRKREETLRREQSRLERCSDRLI